MNQKTADLNMTRVDTKAFPWLTRPEPPAEIDLPFVERLLAEQWRYIERERQGVVGVSDKPNACPIACLLECAGFDMPRTVGLDTAVYVHEERVIVPHTKQVVDLINLIDAGSTNATPISLEQFSAMIEQVKTDE